MPELYANHKRCPSCGYFAGASEWTVISSRLDSGYSSLECREYDTKKKKRDHIGSVYFISCPKCKTIIWNR